MNLADSSTLVVGLTTRGYQRVEEVDEADLIILNTCSVRDKAEQRVLGRLGDLQRLKKSRPGVRIAVVGCMAQRLGNDEPVGLGGGAVEHRIRAGEARRHLVSVRDETGEVHTWHPCRFSLVVKTDRICLL